ncbi:ribbon-helix-helix protein [Acidithiobacillus ferrianus]
MLKGEIAQKVPDGFRRRFKIRAAEEGITGVELLRRLFDAS